MSFQLSTLEMGAKKKKQRSFENKTTTNTLHAKTQFEKSLKSSRGKGRFRRVSFGESSFKGNDSFLLKFLPFLPIHQVYLNIN